MSPLALLPTQHDPRMLLFDHHRLGACHWRSLSDPVRLQRGRKMHQRQADRSIDHELRRVRPWHPLSGGHRRTQRRALRQHGLGLWPLCPAFLPRWSAGLTAVAVTRQVYSHNASTITMQDAEAMGSPRRIAIGLPRTLPGRGAILRPWGEQITRSMPEGCTSPCSTWISSASEGGWGRWMVPSARSRCGGLLTRFGTAETTKRPLTYTARSTAIRLEQVRRPEPNQSAATTRP